MALRLLCSVAVAVDATQAAALPDLPKTVMAGSRAADADASLASPE